MEDHRDASGDWLRLQPAAEVLHRKDTKVPNYG